MKTTLIHNIKFNVLFLYVWKFFKHFRNLTVKQTGNSCRVSPAKLTIKNIYFISLSQIYLNFINLTYLNFINLLNLT